MSAILVVWEAIDSLSIAVDSSVCEAHVGGVRVAAAVDEGLEHVGAAVLTREQEGRQACDRFHHIREYPAVHGACRALVSHPYRTQGRASKLGAQLGCMAVAAAWPWPWRTELVVGGVGVVSLLDEQLDARHHVGLQAQERETSGRRGRGHEGKARHAKKKNVTGLSS